MDLPTEIPVMTLPNATLFPQAMMPVFVYEERYRQMLADVLAGPRMFSIAMRKFGGGKDTPSVVAGVGLVRAAVRNKDGTANLILQGLARVELEPRAKRLKPYRVHRVRALQPALPTGLVVQALMVQLGELVQFRLEKGLKLAGPLIQNLPPGKSGQHVKELALESMKEFARHLGRIKDPGLFADMAACALLPQSQHRQTILESVEVEERLRKLTELLAEGAYPSATDENDDCPF